jgi:hypothetical protein
MSYSYLKNLWVNSGFDAPSIFYLKCNNRYYAVIEDYGSVIQAASKSEAIYAVVKSKLFISQENGVPIYVLEDPYYLRVVSCTVDSIKTIPIQNFVLTQILPTLK